MGLFQQQIWTCWGIPFDHPKSIITVKFEPTKPTNSCCLMISDDLCSLLIHEAITWDGNKSWTGDITGFLLKHQQLVISENWTKQHLQVPYLRQASQVYKTWLLGLAKIPKELIISSTFPGQTISLICFASWSCSLYLFQATHFFTNLF